jgi:hypothetical protein
MTRGKPMCCVRLQYLSLLMPADEGMKLVKLLGSAVTCERNYSNHDYTYDVGDEPEVEFVSVKSSQIRMPRSAQPTAIARPVVGTDGPRLLK